MAEVTGERKRRRSLQTLIAASSCVSKIASERLSPFSLPSALPSHSSAGEGLWRSLGPRETLLWSISLTECVAHTVYVCTHCCDSWKTHVWHVPPSVCRPGVGSGVAAPSMFQCTLSISAAWEWTHVSRWSLEQRNVTSFSESLSIMQKHLPLLSQRRWSYGWCDSQGSRFLCSAAFISTQRLLLL